MDQQTLEFLPFEEGQESIVSDMVWEVFSEFEVPDYSEEGIKTFKEVIVPARLAERVQNNQVKIFCCFDDLKLVGVLSLRDTTHISLLFVRKSHHRRGIAKRLLELAISSIYIVKPDATELTVNSSPYAVKIYEKLGFISTDSMLEKDGIKYTPMRKLLSPSN